jgi:hypothetical protein
MTSKLIKKEKTIKNFEIDVSFKAVFINVHEDYPRNELNSLARLTSE